MTNIDAIMSVIAIACMAAFYHVAVTGSEIFAIAGGLVALVGIVVKSAEIIFWGDK